MPFAAIGFRRGTDIFKALAQSAPDDRTQNEDDTTITKGSKSEKSEKSLSDIVSFAELRDVLYVTGD